MEKIWSNKDGGRTRDLCRLKYQVDERWDDEKEPLSGQGIGLQKEDQVVRDEK